MSDAKSSALTERDRLLAEGQPTPPQLGDLCLQGADRLRRRLLIDLYAHAIWLGLHGIRQLGATRSALSVYALDAAASMWVMSQRLVVKLKPGSNDGRLALQF